MVRAIKSIQMMLILVGFLTGVAASAGTSPQQRVQDKNYDNDIDSGGGGGSFTWPWSLAIPFPWKDIQGIWRADKGGHSFYFGFRRVVVASSSENRLVVKQFDYEGCDLVATGVGFENSKAVVAQMNTNRGQVYRLSLSAFNPEDIPDDAPIVSRLTTDHVMVIQISMLGVQSSADWTMQMVKVSSGLDFKCTDPDKKLKF